MSTLNSRELLLAGVGNRFFNQALFETDPQIASNDFDYVFGFQRCRASQQPSDEPQFVLGPQGSCQFIESHGYFSQRCLNLAAWLPAILQQILCCSAEVAMATVSCG